MTFASNCFGLPSEELPWDRLKRLQALPLDDKIVYTQAKIREFYVAMRGNVYVSYSGGKDSTTLLHLVRSLYPDVPAVFYDTGLEFPEIREHALATPNVVRLKPEMSFRRVIIERGYPVISKQVAHFIDLAQRGCPSGLRQVSMDTMYGIKRYASLVDAPFRVSGECCEIMKKRPARAYERETGRRPFIGTRAEESNLRTQAFYQVSDMVTEGDHPHSTPLSIWTEADIWQYIDRFDVPYSPIYDMGYNRTGCVFCMFGITMDRNRFVKLKSTHPNLHEYCMRNIDDGGLGMKGVLEYMGIPTGCGQSSLDDWMGAQP